MKTNSKQKARHKGFTKIPNKIIFDNRLSSNAKGILQLLLARPDSWRIYVDELSKHSDIDSKGSLRRGLKELVETGYVILKKERDESTNRFIGTRYVLNPSARQLYQESELPKDGFPESREAGLPNKKEKNSNTDISVKINQYQKGISYVDDEKDIHFFLPKLTEDLEWRNLFENQLLGESPIGPIRFNFLLSSFFLNSLRRDNTYTDEQEIKNHFSNWFDKLKRDNILHLKISEQKKNQSSKIEDLEKHFSRIDSAILLLKSGLFKNEAHVLQVKDEMIEEIKQLRFAGLYITRSSNLDSLRAAIYDAKRVVEKIESGRQKGKLHLVCQ